MENGKEALLEKIDKLKKDRNALILAHNYQIDEVQDVADYVCDSFALASIAAQADAEVIVLCGVYFMAEGAAILAPDKAVLLPDPQSGCPLADMVTPEALREKKLKHPGTTVVTYVNSSAEVKAESDICVTSSNAVNVINSLDTDDVLFVPDKNLGSFIADRTDKNMILWDGYCITHHRVSLEDVRAARKAYPGLPIVVHPECQPEVVKATDYAFSTSGILKFAAETSYNKMIIGTEMGLLHRLKKENPEKEFFLLSQKLICPNMKYNNLEKIAAALETLQPRIIVPEEIRVPAQRALERMLAFA